jgi:hypothetical protein
MAIHDLISDGLNRRAATLNGVVNLLPEGVRPALNPVCGLFRAYSGHTERYELLGPHPRLDGSLLPHSTLLLLDCE